MAEAAVSFAVERLGDLLISEAKLLNGVIGEIKKVKRELKRMECFLEEADKKQNRDKRVRLWVEEIRELAFRIEDVIETFAMEVATKSGFKGKLRKFALVSRHNIAMELNDIKAEITNLTTCLQTFGISTGLEEGQTSNSQVDLKSRRISYSHDMEKDFVGMDKEIEQLISDLKKKDMEVVVSICGMGGQGKTTLAKKLYNHAQLKPHFQAFAWVCITQQFERKEILKGVLKQLLPDREEDVSKMDDAKLVKEVSNVQLEKNCLIVIDDIWKVEHWESLKPAFPTTSGSKILLTTRDENVAKIGSVHKIDVLTEDEGWQLLSKKAGINDLPDKKVTSEMETIGRNMVQRCKGLPLAIASLGGILKGKSLTDWEKINKDISHYLSKGERVTNDDDEYYTVKHVLGLSYDSLPPRLRHCFLCFANYKEDEEIWPEELYMFWMAEGLISVEDKAEGEMMLDVAERYLDELARRSLVQVEKYDEVGGSWLKNRTCRVHDLIRDMCLSKVKEEKVIHVIHSQRKPEDESKASIIRRLCIRSSEDGDESMLKPYDQDVISHIRSLLVWKDSDGVGVWSDKILSLKKFKLLRVLILSGYQISKENIRSITELVYLKYLCLRESWLKELPSSIGNLRNLETLDLRVRDTISVPNVLWKLEQLKHLYLPLWFEVKGGRVEKLRLKGLNKLEVIHNYKYCDAHDLIQLPKLKVFTGTIVVEDNLAGNNIIDYIKSRELRHSYLEIEGEGIMCLVLLLECCFIDKLTIRTPLCRFPKEYDHTRFSGRLTYLKLKDCRMEEDPMILLEKLLNLRTLALYTDACLNLEMVCSSEGFPQLEKLDLWKLPNLRNWRVDEGAMPNLSFLEISDCQELEMLPEGLIYLTALQALHILGMPRTFKNRIKGEDFYKVRHIPKVHIFGTFQK